MTKILGLGHSHIVAIAKGCYELQDEGFQLGGAPLVSRFLYLYDPELTPTLTEEGYVGIDVIRALAVSCNGFFFATFAAT